MRHPFVPGLQPRLPTMHSRFMNQYFLMIAILQLWPAIVIVSPLLSMLPLTFILTLSMVKVPSTLYLPPPRSLVLNRLRRPQEAVDDYYRWKSDKGANERQYWVVRLGEKRQVQSQDLRVGGAAHPACAPSRVG